MLINREEREKINDFFQIIKLQRKSEFTSLKKNIKIEQIIAYLEILHAELRKVSKKRRIVLVDTGGERCYLGFLAYYFYQNIVQRDIEIHCIEPNVQLLDDQRALAKRLNFEHMYFSACELSDFSLDQKVDVVYSLRAFDTAADETMYLGVRHSARIVLSVSTSGKGSAISNNRLEPVLRHSSFNGKVIMMISDSLRALLLEKQGYKVDIFDYVSSRYAQENTMIRAVLTNFKKQLNPVEEYKIVSEEFKIYPYLEELLALHAAGNY